jgi:hypothetical protein
MRYDVIPPSVLPIVATISAGHWSSGALCSSARSTSSEFPGSSVAQRKLLANSPHSPSESSAPPIASPRRDGRAPGYAAQSSTTLPLWPESIVANAAW